MRQSPSRLTSTQVARTSRSLATASCPGKMIPSSLTTMAVSPARERTSTGRAATRDPLSGPANAVGHIRADLLTVLLVDAGLDHAGVLGIVGHERLGVASFPRPVQARQHVKNGLPAGIGPCRGGLAGHRSPRFSPRGGERHPWKDGWARPERTPPRREAGKARRASTTRPAATDRPPPTCPPACRLHGRRSGPVERRRAGRRGDRSSMAKPSWYLVATEDRMIPPPAQPAPFWDYQHKQQAIARPGKSASRTRMHSIRHHPASVRTQIRHFGRAATGHWSDQDVAHSGGYLRAEPSPGPVTQRKRDNRAMARVPDTRVSSSLTLPSRYSVLSRSMSMGWPPPVSRRHAGHARSGGTWASSRRCGGRAAWVGPDARCRGSMRRGGGYGWEP